MSIRIALVDSGVNMRHPHVKNVTGGLSIRTDDAGYICYAKDFHDNIGHGTALAGIFGSCAPKADIFVLRIFDQELRASVFSLTEALNFAISDQFDLIHLSLGIQQVEYKSDLQTLCQIAFENKIVVVASAGHPDHEVFPSSFNTVIGAYRNQDCQLGSIVYHPDKKIQFGTYGSPLPLPGVSQNVNFQGSSFAAAYVSSELIKLRYKYPRAGPKMLKDMLAVRAELSSDQQLAAQHT